MHSTFNFPHKESTTLSTGDMDLDEVCEWSISEDWHWIEAVIENG